MNFLEHLIDSVEHLLHSEKVSPDIDLSQFPPEVIEAAKARLQKKETERLVYPVVQSTLEIYEEVNWPENSLTNRNHGDTVELLHRLVDQILDGKPLDKTLAKLARDLYLMTRTDRLMRLLSWLVLDEEFASFKYYYHGTLNRDGLKPEYRLVRKRLEAHVSGLDLDPEMAALASVGRCNVLGGYKGEPFGFWHGDDPYDVIHWYAHMIERVMWRLYDEELPAELDWLRNSGVVETVDQQVYLLYHALLYKQIGEKERLKMEARDMEAGESRKRR